MQGKGNTVRTGAAEGIPCNCNAKERQNKTTAAYFSKFQRRGTLKGRKATKKRVRGGGFREGSLRNGWEVGNGEGCGGAKETGGRP